MKHLREFMIHLPTRHKTALEWFIRKQGEEQPWPQPLVYGGEEITHLATKAKGIYKPKWSQYALSVRQVLDGPYADREPVFRRDGTWRYEYFQENVDPLDRDEEFTNKGLLACWQDRVPIGVMRQTSRKPKVRYMILGVALVAGWEVGYFLLEGFSNDGILHKTTQQQTKKKRGKR